MGEAAYQKGFDAGRRWSEPSDGERRIDLPLEQWRWIRYLAHIGFLNQMPNYAPARHDQLAPAFAIAYDRRQVVGKDARQNG